MSRINLDPGGGGGGDDDEEDDEPIDTSTTTTTTTSRSTTPGRVSPDTGTSSTDTSDLHVSGGGGGSRSTTLDAGSGADTGIDTESIMTDSRLGSEQAETLDQVSPGRTETLDVDDDDSFDVGGIPGSSTAGRVGSGLRETVSSLASGDIGGATDPAQTAIRETTVEAPMRFGARFNPRVDDPSEVDAAEGVGEAFGLAESAASDAVEGTRLDNRATSFLGQAFVAEPVREATQFATEIDAREGEIEEDPSLMETAFGALSFTGGGLVAGRVGRGGLDNLNRLRNADRAEDVGTAGQATRQTDRAQDTSRVDDLGLSTGGTGGTATQTAGIGGLFQGVRRGGEEVLSRLRRSGDDATTGSPSGSTTASDANVLDPSDNLPVLHRSEQAGTSGRTADRAEDATTAGQAARTGDTAEDVTTGGFGQARRQGDRVEDATTVGQFGRTGDRAEDAATFGQGARAGDRGIDASRIRTTTPAGTRLGERIRNFGSRIPTPSPSTAALGGVAAGGLGAGALFLGDEGGQQTAGADPGTDPDDIADSGVFDGSVSAPDTALPGEQITISAEITADGSAQGSFLAAAIVPPAYHQQDSDALLPIGSQTSAIQFESGETQSFTFTGAAPAAPGEELRVVVDDMGSGRVATTTLEITDDGSGGAGDRDEPEAQWSGTLITPDSIALDGEPFEVQGTVEPDIGDDTRWEGRVFLLTEIEFEGQTELFEWGELGTVNASGGEVATVEASFPAEELWGIEAQDATLEMFIEGDGAGIIDTDDVEYVYDEDDPSDAPGDGDEDEESVWADPALVQELDFGWSLWVQERLDGSDERFSIIGMDGEATIYLAPGADVQDNPHYYDTIDAAERAYIEWVQAFDEGDISEGEVPDGPTPGRGQVAEDQDGAGEQDASLFSDPVGWASQNTTSALIYGAAAVLLLYFLNQQYGIGDGVLDWMSDRVEGAQNVISNIGG